ncbi:MAG TPA: rRNA maturation RNase YbeY [Edaphocola sp.]|nr:rRNA maturation RNase YbeY [Edaphocola sp.]
MAIRYYEEDGTKARLKQRRALTSFIENSIIKQHLDIENIQINYIFCNDEQLLEKNIQFLNHNTLTDILTFDLSEKEEELLSEIYISIDRVIDNAKTLNIPYQKELHRVIFHGVLHLCGFKDKSEKQEKEMRLQEDLCLNNYFG